MTTAKELLEKHLGPATMEDAVNRLARLVNLEDLAASDPPKFLHEVADELERLHKVILRCNPDEPNIREAAGDVIDAMVLRGHPFEESWEKLLILCGRYCEPFKSYRYGGVLVSGGSIDQAAEIARLQNKLQRVVNIIKENPMSDDEYGKAV